MSVEKSAEFQGSDDSLLKRTEQTLQAGMPEMTNRLTYACGNAKLAS